MAASLKRMATQPEETLFNVEVQEPCQRPPARIRRLSSRRFSRTYSYSDEPELVCIRGETTLCFENDGKSFRGVINSLDGNFYSIVGKRNKNLGEERCVCDCSSSESSDEEESVPLLFNVRIKDHDDPTEYSLQDIHVHIGRDCRFKCLNISFTSTNSYKGHKAQLVAQSCLGRIVAFDSNPKVYTGQIDITVLENKPIPKHWAM